MFQDEYEKMSNSDRTLFSSVCNDLLYECFITRKTYDRKTKIFKINTDYIFLEKYYSVFEEYLQFVDLQISKSDTDGVIFLTSGADRNHLRFDPVTTLVSFALRSYYEGAIERVPQEMEVLMTSGALKSLITEMGLSNVTKRISPTSIASSLRTLDGFNVITRASNTYGDPSYSFFILPTIRYIISSEKLNALYKLVTEEPEEKIDDKLSQTFLGDAGGNL